MTEEQGSRYVMGFCVLATLATIFLCVVATPVLLVIGFSGQFEAMWAWVAAYPIRTALGLVAFVATIIGWLWLIIAFSRELARDY